MDTEQLGRKPDERLSVAKAREEFRLRCESRNLSGGTLEWYEQVIGGLEAFLATRDRIFEMERVQPSTIRAYLSQLRARDLSSETIHRTYGGLRCFFKFLLREKLIEVDPMDLVERPKRERHLIHPLSPEQALGLMKQPDEKTFLGRRNKVMIMLMLDSGLRLSEMLSLKMKDIDMEEGTLIVMGKGRKERRIPFAKIMRRQLEDYLADRRRIVVPSELLFIGRDGEELTSRHIQLTVHRYGREAGIQGVRVSPHTLRHTFATQWIRNGGDPFSLQVILGHSTLEMVRNYVNLGNRDVVRAHQRFSPVDNSRMAPQPAAAAASALTKIDEGDILVRRALQLLTMTNKIEHEDAQSRVLRFLWRSRAEWSGREIARKVGLSAPACHDALKKLNARGLVLFRQVSNVHLYQINPDSYLVQNVFARQFEAEAAMPKKIAAEIRNTLVHGKDIDIDGIAIFGSFAKGTQILGTSDLDLLVVVETKDGAKELEPRLERLREHLFKRFSMPLSPYVQTRSELRHKYAEGLPLIREILKDGKTVYGKDVKELVASRRRS